MSGDLEERMAQEQGKLKAHIDAEGEGLRDNFEEIENRVKDALDWRVWYKNNTALALGGAAAGGILLSLLLPRSSSVESRFVDMDEQSIYGEPPPARSDSPSRFHQVLDNTAAAVLGVATDKLQDFMSRAIPGFREHYSNAHRRQRD